MTPDRFIKEILQDVAVDLMDGMDRNFERKAFFDRQWPARKSSGRKGTSLMVSGALRRGNRSSVSGHSIRFSNSMPYAKIHNEGGEITVTQKMKSFFWAMHMKTSKAGGSAERQKSMSEESKMWRSMALMKVGSKIKIPKRQFIGFHPSQTRIIDEIVSEHLDEFSKYIKSILKK